MDDYRREREQLLEEHGELTVDQRVTLLEGFFPRAEHRQRRALGAFLVFLALMGAVAAALITKGGTDRAQSEDLAGLACTQANSVALSYRLPLPDESWSHFAARMRGQRLQLRETRGVGCGQLAGLQDFPEARARALEEIARILANPPPRGQRDEPAEAPGPDLGLPDQALSSPGSTSSSPPADVPTQTGQAGPEGQPGPQGQPGPGGDGGSEPTPGPGPIPPDRGPIGEVVDDVAATLDDVGQAVDQTLCRVDPQRC